VRRVAHLVSRFFGSLRPRALDAETIAWVERMLEPGELHVWEGFGPADRAESVAVARRFEIGREDDAVRMSADPVWTAAALLHDAGKQGSGYGPIGRAVATVVIALAGNDKARLWAVTGGPVRARIGRYAAHDKIGAELLTVARARPAVIAWAGAHHRPGLWSSTGFPSPVCRALAVADGESVPDDERRGSG
jgi:hypothetical protein